MKTRPNKIASGDETGDGLPMRPRYPPASMMANMRQFVGRIGSKCDLSGFWQKNSKHQKNATGTGMALARWTITTYRATPLAETLSVAMA